MDIRLQGERNEIDLGGRKIEAIHTPGHSPGSLVYLKTYPRAGALRRRESVIPVETGIKIPFIPGA